MTQSAAWLARCERSYELAAERQRDAADDAEAYAEALTEEIRESLSPATRAQVFDDAWADEGMIDNDLMIVLRDYWSTDDDETRERLVARLGQLILNFAEDAVDRRVEQLVAERIQRERYDAYRGRRDDD